MTATHALLIGIDDYSRFDPTGRNDLRGAVEDANRWQRYLTTRLGVPAEQIRVLTSGGTEPTRDAIRAGVAWLVEQLRAAGPDAAGLITFSGHGAGAADTGTARLGLTDCLCPADVAARADGLLDHTVSFATLQRWLQAHDDPAADPRHRLSHNVTVVVDACYGVKKQGPRMRSLGATAAAGGEAGASEVTSRLLLGCQPWGESYELSADGAMHGAFTWCLLTLLERWTVRTEGSQTFVNVATSDLVHRARTMLDVLGIGQAPWTLGPPYTALLPFLYAGADLAGHPTSPTPDVALPGSQLESPVGGNNFRVVTVTAAWADGTTKVVYVCVEPPTLSTTTISGHPLVGTVENEIFCPLPAGKSVSDITGFTVSGVNETSPTLPTDGFTPVAMMSRCYWAPQGGVSFLPGITWSPLLQATDPGSGAPIQLRLGVGSDMKGRIWWKRSGAASPYVFNVSGAFTTPFTAPPSPPTMSAVTEWGGNPAAPPGPALGQPDDQHLACNGTQAPWGLGYTFRYCTVWCAANVEGPISPIVSFVNSAAGYWATELWLDPAIASFPAGSAVRVYRQILAPKPNKPNEWIVVQGWQLVNTFTAPPASGQYWVDQTVGVP